MRTKAVLCAVALAAGAATSMAQSNVYSLNVVGYMNITATTGSTPTDPHRFTFAANQLVQTNSQVQNIFASVPDNTTIAQWTGVAFAPDTFAGGAWDDGTESIGPGVGFYIRNAQPTNFTVTFVGEVNQNTNTINFAAGQYKLVSLFTPQAGNLQTDFGYPVSTTHNDFDTILKWNGAGYSIYTFDTSDPSPVNWFWDPLEPPVVVGEGFFVKPTGARTWTRSFKVQ